jgi:hypothetical protein
MKFQCSYNISANFVFVPIEPKKTMQIPRNSLFQNVQTSQAESPISPTKTSFISFKADNPFNFKNQSMNENALTTKREYSSSSNNFPKNP